MLPRQQQIESKTVIFKRRKNDYLKGKLHKSLVKDLSLFSKTNGSQYGGSSYGPYLKKRTHCESRTLYYITAHNPAEYFALEVLQRIGFNTPVARIVTSHPLRRESVNLDGKQAVATKGFHGYVPIQTVRPDEPKSSEFGKQHTLDFINQIITNSKGTKFKISGNLFALDIGAILLGDTDLQPRGNNIGFIKEGNRFYTVAIDKEHVVFNGNNYCQMSGRIDPVDHDKLFVHKLHDQRLFILSQIAGALHVDESGLCDFDRIFLNPRVTLTPCLADKCKIWCDNLKKTALSIIEHYKSAYGKDFLVHFNAREKMRSELADKVIAFLNNASIDAQALKDIIMEDLRGPYYVSYLTGNEFCDRDARDNPRLFNAIVADVAKEFNLVDLNCFDESTDNVLNEGVCNDDAADASNSDVRLMYL